MYIGFWVYGRGFRDLGLGIGGWGLRFRVYVGFRVQG